MLIEANCVIEREEKKKEILAAFPEKSMKLFRVALHYLEYQRKLEHPESLSISLYKIQLSSNSNFQKKEILFLNIASNSRSYNKLIPNKLFKKNCRF